MKFCNECGTKISESQKFCAACGATVKNEVATEKKKVPVNIEVGEKLVGEKLVEEKRSIIKEEKNRKVSENINEEKISIGNETNKVNKNKTERKLLNLKFNKVIIIPAIAIVVIIAGFISTKMYFSIKYSPDKLVDNFYNAIVNSDVELLKQMLYTNDEKLELDEASINSLITYFNESNLKLKDIMSSLKEDISMANRLSVKGSQILFNDKESFALTLDRKNVLFNKYIIMIKPMYINILAKAQDAKVFHNGQDTGVLVKDVKSDFGPVILGDVIYLSTTVDGNEEKTEEIKVNEYNIGMSLNFGDEDDSVIDSNITRGNTNIGSNVNSANLTDNIYIEKYKNIDYVIPNINNVEIVFKDLNSYTYEELFIARNELFGRHGYVFKSYPNLQKYFESKKWYKSNPSYSGELTGDVEKFNLGQLKSIEFLKMASEKYPTITREYVFSNSDTIELKKSDVIELNDWELIIARNEIFARYGLEFSTKELMNHFKTKSWFIIDSSVGNDVQLTSTERKNVETILEEEKKRIEIVINHDLGN